MLIDTHCHIQSIGSNKDDFTTKKWRDGGIANPDGIIQKAADAGVKKLICVGTDLQDSINAEKFAANRDNCWASVGVHPHEAKETLKESGWVDRLAELATAGGKVVAVGEIGLDYYYEHSPKKEQIEVFEQLLDLAKTNDLPVIFHVREAFDDFWPLLDNFRGVKGVVHSFSADRTVLDQALRRDLYVGLNGIMTFTRDEKQLEAARAVPADRLLLETDAPYLTPRPVRGKVCSPEHIKLICEFLCELRGEAFDELAARTTQNAKKLFRIK
jgi:TatD DNase family protein